MTANQLVLSGALVSFVTTGSSYVGTVAAQPGAATSQSIWENDRVRVQRVTLAPGETLSRESTGGSVIVFLTADLDGHIPAAEAAWRDPGPATLENRGRARFEALIVDLKGSATHAGGMTPPEVARATGTIAPHALAGSYELTRRAQNLIVNDRVSVTKERYAAAWPVDPLHFHPQDGVVIYLRGGYIGPATWFEGPEHVRRGDVRVIPGNVLHTAGNAGSDPLEFLLIFPA